MIVSDDANLEFEATSVHYSEMLLMFPHYSDKLVEKAVGISSVAEIFQLHSEAFFRDNEVYACFSRDMRLISISFLGMKNESESKPFSSHLGLVVAGI
jgi:hypothetical protein